MTRLFFTGFLLLITVTVTAQTSLRKTLSTMPFSARHDLKIPLSDRQGNHVSLPVTLIKGKKDGPVFTVIAGIHGYEYPPIIAVQEFLKDIDISRLEGSLVIVPVANMPAFERRSVFFNPQDVKNLNNVFPGSADGSITEKIAHYFTTEIIPLSDVFLDIHAGDANEDLLPFICYYDAQEYAAQTQHAAKLCEISSFETIVSYPYHLRKDQPAVYAFKQAVQDGKTALSIESGRLGSVEGEAVKLIKESIFRMLATMKMYPEQDPKATETITKFNRQAYVKATESGIFYSPLKAGDAVSENQVIGYVTDEFGNMKGKITAPASGTVLYKIGTPPVNTGETVFCIGYRENR